MRIIKDRYLEIYSHVRVLAFDWLISVILRARQEKSGTHDYAGYVLRKASSNACRNAFQSHTYVRYRTSRVES